MVMSMYIYLRIITLLQTKIEDFYKSLAMFGHFEVHAINKRGLRKDYTCSMRTYEAPSSLYVVLEIRPQLCKERIIISYPADKSLSGG